jgi:hypothetical protein
MSDSRDLIVIPQRFLYYVPTDDDDDDGSNDGSNDLDVLADTIMSTIASRGVHQSRKISGGDYFRFRNHTCHVKIQYAGVPLLAEIKRAGSRSLDGLEFYQSKYYAHDVTYSDRPRTCARCVGANSLSYSLLAAVFIGPAWLRANKMSWSE